PGEGRQGRGVDRHRARARPGLRRDRARRGADEVPPRPRRLLDHHRPLPAQAHRSGRRRQGPPPGALALRHQPPPAAPSMKRTVLALLPAALAGCGHPFVPYTPAGFVDLGDKYPNGEYRASTADGVVIGIRAWDNEPKGALVFWARVLERRMREMGGYAL